MRPLCFNFNNLHRHLKRLRFRRDEIRCTLASLLFGLAGIGWGNPEKENDSGIPLPEPGTIRLGPNRGESCYQEFEISQVALSCHAIPSKVEFSAASQFRILNVSSSGGGLFGR